MTRPVRQVRFRNLLGLAQLCAVLSSAFCSTSLWADVTSAGDAVGTTVSGATDFTISDGTVSGTNLFHSFNQFNLTSAQSATFTYGGMGTIDNVVGRILGGASSIDGLIGFDGTLPSSNLYLINPAGIVFGANAQLNVPGSFHASTADYVTFSNGETWGAFVPATQTLSTAPPSAFGFLGDASFNSIAVQSGASLSVDTNNTLSLVGSGITVDNAALNVESGQVNLISIASAGTVSSLDSTPSATGIGGNVDVTGTTINVSGADNDAGADGAGGSVYIKGGNLALNGGSVFALHYSDTTDAGDFDFKATGDLDLTNAFVYSGANLFNPSTGGDADSGDITFNAGTFTATGSNIYSLAGGASSSGNIVVSANDGVTESYDYANSVYPTAADADIVIDNSTFYSAALSTASYDADASGVDPGYIFFSSDSLYMNSGDIYASTFSDNAASSAGYVYLFGNYSYLTNSSQVHTDTTSAGDAGYILLIGTDWLVDGGSSITSDATISATTGSAGDIRITVDNFVLDNATMGTSVLGSGSGDAGGITVDDCFIFCGGFFGSEFDPTDSFTLKNGASLVSDTQTGTGNAGDITIHTGVLTIESGSTVSSVTNSGLGGSINFDVLTSVTIDGAGTEVKADSIGSGPAGDVNISTENDLSLFDMADAAGDSVTIQNDASVSSSSETDVGDAGAVVVETDDLVIQGTDTVINTTTNAGQGGNITLTVGNTATISGGANIVSNTTGDGDAGAIMIAGGEWDLTGTGTITDYIIESSQISNGLGDAGDITIDVSKLSMNGSAVVASSTTSTTVGPLGETSDAGNIDVTVNDGMAVDWTDDTTFENTADLKLGNTSGINGFHSLSCEYAGSSCVSGTGVGKAGTISINTESLYADTADIIAYTIDSGDNTVVGGVGSLDIDAQYALVEGVTYIKADTFGAGDAGSIDIDGIEWVVRGASYITSTSDPFTAMDAGDAGGINITGTNISIEGGSTVSSSTTGSGDAGNIYIYANTIDVLSNSRVESKSQSSGTPGIVALLATLGSTATQALTVDNSVISASNVDGVVNGDLDSYTWLRTFGTGTIQNGSTIESKTTGNGDAGSIYIQNGNWTIDNSSVTSSQTGTTGTGSAGTIWIGASPTNPTQRFLGTLDIQNGASVTSETTSTNAASDAGNILIYANTDITIDNATVSSSTGAGSPGNAGTIDISTEQDVALGTDVATDSVTIQGTATVSTDSSQGTGPAGDITITTDNFLIDGATITSQTNDGYDAGSMSLEPGSITLTAASGTITHTTAEDTIISASTSGSGTAGSIAILGGDWTILGDNMMLGATVVTSSTTSTGNAGIISIDVQNITISDYAQVTTSTTSSGNAGNVTVGGDQSVTVNNFAEVSSTSTSSGNAGTVTITTENGTMEGLTGDTLTIDESANVTSSSTGSGAAGNLILATDDFYLDGVSITSETVNGAGGSISITANNTGVITNTVAAKTEISASTSGLGQAGSIALMGGAWTISGDADPTPVPDATEGLGSTEISSSTSGDGAAGSVEINVSSLSIDDFAIVKTETTAAGKAGNISLIAEGSVLLDTNAVVSSSAIGGATGSAGNILITTEHIDEIGDVDTDTVALQGNAKVTSSSENGTSIGAGSGNPGQIVIDTDTFTMTGVDTEINTTNNAGPNVGPMFDNGIISITATSGTINTSATSGDAAEIKANTVGDGNAGAIEISGDSWTIYGTTGFSYPDYQAQISTNQTNISGLGDAGGILIDVTHLEMRNNGKVESSTNSTATVVDPMTMEVIDTSDAGKIVLNIDDGLDDPGTNDLLLIGGIPQIYSNSTGNGAAGDIEVNTGTMYLDTADVFAQNHNGPGGTITIDADYATVTATTYIKTDTDGTGTAGDINLTGGDWTVSGSNQITSTTTGAVPSAGDAGNILFDVDTLQMTSFNRISTSTGNNDAAAGTITLQAASGISVSGNNIISSDSSSGTGDAGSITVIAPSFTIDNSTMSTTINSGLDGSGSITINASTANIINNTDITASTIGDANAGSIIFTGTDLNINTGSQVSSSSDMSATADAGIIDMDVTTLTLDTGAQVGTNSTTSGAAGDVEVVADTVNILGGATLSSSSEAGAGDAGSVTIAAPNFTVDGIGSSVNTVINAGTDASGSITITADNGTVSNSGEVSASTVGNADAGSVSLLGGSWSVESSGVVTSSADAGIASTNAGQINIDVTSLVVQTSGQVKTDTGVGSPASAGNIVVFADDVSVLTDGEISSSSADGTGTAGNVTITTPTLVMDDSEITTETADGPGGTITIAANISTISNFSDITADTEGTGGAGDINITGDLWTIQTGSVISSDSQAGTGTAGNINMTVGDIIIDGATISTITNASQGGTITLNATNVNTGHITNNGQVFADTIGTGNAGDVILLGNWIIDGASTVSSSSLPVATTGGNAGTISIAGDSFLLDGATVATNSDSSGTAGSITITSGVINVNNGADISSNTSFTGGGGVVTLNSSGNIFLSGGSTLSTTTSYSAGSDGGNAGNIFINAVDSLYMYSSSMTSSTTGSGDAGSIFINTGNLTYLLNSTVFSDADTLYNVGGGNLDVDTSLLVLDSSTLDVSSNFATGGNVTINADYVFFSPDSVIDVSSTFGTAGTLSVNAVAVDLSGGLNALKIRFNDGGKLLRQSCNVQNSAGSSSFIVDNGINGIPAAPGGLQSGSILDVDFNGEVSGTTSFIPPAGAISGTAVFAASMCGGF